MLKTAVGAGTRGVVLAAALLVGCSGSADSREGHGEGKPADKPNVLLVTLDTTRVDHLSCYAPRQGRLTPSFDALAADGIRFALAIAQSPATPMSHASILTGLYPYQHGVRVIAADAGYHLSPTIPTLASVLQRHGWETAAFVSAFTVSEYYGFEQGFETFDNGLRQDADTIIYEQDGRRRWKQSVHQRRADATTDQALAWLRSGQRPFLLWVHYWDPHDRMVLPPAEVLRRFVTPGMKPNSPQWKRAVYRAEVHFVDAQFGRLLAALRAAGEYDKTLIVVVADHGQGLGQHGWWAHRLPYQEDLHVPLILRVPDWPRGRVVPELVRTIDIYPTVLDVLGLPAPRPVAGLSLRPLVFGQTETPRLAYAEVLNKYDLNSPVVQKRPKDDLVYCALDQTWKLIYRYSYPDDSELFNLAVDPQELHNRYRQQPDQVRRLKAILDGHNAYVTAPFGSGMPEAEALRALESLGYVGGTDDEAGEPNSPAGSRPATAPAERP